MRERKLRAGRASLKALLRTTSAAVFGALLVATLLVAVVFGEVVDSFTHSRDLDRTALATGDAAKSVSTLADQLHAAMVAPVDLPAGLADADREIWASLSEAAQVDVSSVRTALEASEQAWDGAEAQIAAVVQAGAPDPQRLHDMASRVLGQVQAAFVPVWQATSAESARRAASARRSKARLQAELLILLGGSLAILAWFHRRVRRDVVAPLGRLRAASERIGHGDLAASVPLTWTAELLDVIGAFNLMADGLADRARLEAQLRHAQKLESVGQLAAGIAHEINTPIQFVGDNVRFLQDAFRGLSRVVDAYGDVGDSSGPEAALERARDVADEVDLAFLVAEVPEAIDQTLDGVQRVATVVRAMKAFAHPAGDDKVLADLNEAVRNTLVVASNELKCVAEVVTDLTELPLVPCHLGDVNQVLLNLVVNAAHAVGDVVKDSGARGTISVRTRLDGDDVVIEIADTGTGIPPEIADRIFEPFFTTKPVGSGTGQGLALAFTLVTDRHGGTIGFRSEPGAGTTFTVRLPAGGTSVELLASGVVA